MYNSVSPSFIVNTAKLFNPLLLLNVSTLLGIVKDKRLLQPSNAPFPTYNNPSLSLIVWNFWFAKVLLQIHVTFDGTEYSLSSIVPLYLYITEPIITGPSPTPSNILVPSKALE